MPQSYNLAYVPEEGETSSVVFKKRSANSTEEVVESDIPNGVTQNGVKTRHTEAIEFKEIDLNDDSEKDFRGEKKTKEKPAIRSATLAELFSFATWLDRFLMLVGTLAAIAHGASWPILMITFGDMTDAFVSYGENTTAAMNSTGGDDFEDTMTEYSLRYVYIGTGVAVATYLQMTTWSGVCERQTHKLRKAFFRALLKQEIGWYDKQQSGDLTTKLADDLERVKEGTGEKVSLAIQFISQFASGFILGFLKGWKMTLILMSLTPIMVVLSAVLAKVTVSYSTREQLSYSKAGAVAEEVLSCIRTVASFNGHGHEIKRYTTALAECKRLGNRKALFVGFSTGSTMLVMFCSYGLAFWYGSTQVHDYNESMGEEGLSPGSVMSIFFSVLIGSFALGTASPHINSFLSAKGAAGTIYPILKAKHTIDASSPKGQKPASIKGHIEYKNVGFFYPTRPEAKVLKDFNLEIHPGQTIALVGASGCGKSTVVNLIQRFYDPDEGRVLLDGVDIRDLNLHYLREKIGIVSQEPILFGMSIAKNIELGRPGASMDEIIAASKMANAHNFIADLPDRYDTLVGERGAQLSGGQKQRVAIARALIRDPSIMLLDEATSALDSESEGIVQAALDKASVGRTTIIIAHRLSTIQNADVIYVVEEGQVVEMGKHAELMALKGAYFKLVTLQMIVEADEEMEEDEECVIKENEEMLPRKRTLSAQKSVEGIKRTKSVKDEKSPVKKSRSNLFGKKKEKEEDEEEKDLEKPGFGRILKSNTKEWPLIIAGILASILQGSLFPMFAIFFSNVVKTFSQTGDQLLDDGILWSMMFVALGAASFIANVVQNGSFGYSGEQLTYRLRSAAFTSIIRQDIAYFDDSKHSTGALVTRLATDASMIKGATGVRMGIILQALTSMVGGLVIALYFGWKLALAIIGCIPILIVASMLNMRLLRGNQERDAELLEDAGKTAGECVENIRTVQGLTREAHFYDHYCEQLVKPHKENMKQANIYGLSYAFSQGVIFFLYAGAFWFGAWLIANDGMEPSLVFRVFFAITFTGMAIGQASSFLPDYAKAQLSASKIFTILDTVPKIDIFNTDGKLQDKVTGKISLKKIHFRYISRPDVEVLKGVSLEVLPGQTAALVGISGCGKSTIMSLIQRFYDPESGSILVEGVDIKDYNLKSLRSMISVVSQEPVLFDSTIRENIMYGLEKDVPMSNVIEAARTANAHDFISGLPDGYETTVGEKGTQLSGGQKQRVAIARALIRNPKILLLDEATSALDTESEKVVQNALDNAREGRTCIVIAHRLSTIQNADVIYVMESGRLLEKGTHQELLAKKGAYSVLVGGQQFKKTED